MCDVVILKAAHHMDNGVYLPDMGEKFVAQTLALGRTLDQSCNVHKLNGGRREFVRVVHFCQLVQPFIRHADHTHIRLYCAKGVVGALGACVCNGVKKCTFANIWQTYDTKFHSFSSDV